MEKLARKPSTDPVQEKLRQNKALWNKDVSMFINDLIHLKKTMNGWPSKFFQEKSTIKEPVPADAPTIIGSLAGDFQGLAERANKIVQEQLTYSKNRRKRQPKQLNLPLGTPAPKPESEAPKPDLSQQLSFPTMAAKKSDLIKLGASLEQKYELTSEASNPFSRMWFRTKNPMIGFSGKKLERRRTRRTMLSSILSSWKALEKFQVLVVKSSDESINDSYQKMQDIWADFQNAVRTYVDHKKDVAASQAEIDSKIQDQDGRQGHVDSPDGSAPNDAGEQESSPSIKPSGKTMNDNQIIQAMVTDYLAYRDVLRPFDTTGTFKDLDAYCDVYKAVKGKLRAADATKIMAAFAYGLLSVGRSVGLTTPQSFREAAEAAQKAKPPAAPAVPATPPPDANKASDIEKVAQDFLKRWIGKGRHSVLPGKTSDQRLRCYRMAERLRKKLDKIMDEIQGEFRFDVLDNLLHDANEEVNALKGMVRNLYTVYMRSHRQEKQDKK